MSLPAHPGAAISYIDQHAQGDLVSRVIADVDTFADGLLMGFTQLFTGVMTILGTLVFMMRIHWGTALVVVCITPLSWWWPTSLLPVPTLCSASRR